MEVSAHAILYWIIWRTARRISEWCGWKKRRVRKDSVMLVFEHAVETDLEELMADGLDQERFAGLIKVT